jgi:hypothetical protein
MGGPVLPLALAALLLLLAGRIRAPLLPRRIGQALAVLLLAVGVSWLAARPGGVFGGLFDLPGFGQRRWHSP